MKEQKNSVSRFLDDLGVPGLAPATVPFDPGYDPATVEGHLEQSHHFMAGLKLSMATWMVAAESSVRKKVAAAKRFDVPTVAGGGPWEIASVCAMLDRYLDVCADYGFSRIEAAAGFTESRPDPTTTVEDAMQRGLEVQFELGKKHDGPLDASTAADVIREGRAWLEAGAKEVVVEARESANAVGVFGNDGELRGDLADQIATGLGLTKVLFEAPDKRSQFALMSHFGPEVRLGNVRLEEVLRVEIYRRGLHSDAFSDPALAPYRDAVDKSERG